MRIAVVNFSSRRVGGAESYLEEVIAEFAKSGHEVGLFVEYDVPANRPPIRLPGESPLWCVANQAIAGATARLREWHPDLIFAHGLVNPRNEAATLSVAPAVFFAHGYYGTCISGAKTNSYPNIVPCSRTFGPKCLLHFYPRRCGGLSPVTALTEYRRQAKRLELLRRYRAILTDSTHMRDEYLRHGFDPNIVVRSSYLRDPSPGPDTSIETAIESATVPNRDANGSASRGPARLLFLGRMDVLKGGLILLDSLPTVASALDRPIELTFGGDGPARDSWTRRARAIGAKDGRVTTVFEGWLGPERIEELQAASDLLVLPSLWPEPFGRVGLESGLRGLPAAAFAVGGIPDWLHDGVNGYMAPGDAATPGGLADAIVKCLRTTAEHERLRRGAIAVAGRFNLHNHMAQLYELFDKVAGRSGASRGLPEMPCH
jgi:glycosyltransferase involved in cell wall biosynthesis